MTDLTNRQQAILDFVAARVEAQGLPPTLAEIAAAFGFNQTRGAHKHLLALEAKGHLTLLPGKARGIRLRGRNRMRPSKPALLLPILGRVAAGAPIGADADVERHLLLDRALFSPTPDYLLKVKGDSMIDDGILDGDLVAVHRTDVAATARSWSRASMANSPSSGSSAATHGIRLLPRNPEYAPIEIEPGQDFAIEGLYCGLVRSA